MWPGFGCWVNPMWNAEPSSRAAWMLLSNSSPRSPETFPKAGRLPYGTGARPRASSCPPPRAPGPLAARHHSHVLCTTKAVLHMCADSSVISLSACPRGCGSPLHPLGGTPSPVSPRDARPLCVSSVLLGEDPCPPSLPDSVITAVCEGGTGWPFFRHMIRLSYCGGRVPSRGTVGGERAPGPES